MNEKYVVSLDLARKLKDLGVKQESDFYWVNSNNLPTSKWELNYHDTEEFYTAQTKCYEIISAFHVGELGEMLPKKISMGHYYTYKDYNGDWIAWEDEEGLYIEGNLIVEFTEANARAKLYVCLIENKLIKIEDIKC